MHRKPDDSIRAAGLALLLAGCAMVDPRGDFDEAAEEIRATTGAALVFDPEGPVLSVAEIRTALADGLGLEEATRLALLNNRRLQAGFLALGVARADYVQSGLLRNPSLSLALFFPDAGGRTRWTADLLANVSDLWEIPLRRKAAGERIEQQVLELARFAGELVFRTREAYLETVMARELSLLAREDAELTRRSREAVSRQFEEGMATRTDESLAESHALLAELGLTRSRREEAEASRRLAALLSLEEDLLEVPLADALPRPPGTALPREALIERGLDHRPDLRALEREIAAVQEEVSLERRRRFPELEAGVSAERPEGDSSADFFLGPGATLEIPVFDQNQAQVSRAEYRLAELRKEHDALVVEVTQEVRAAADEVALTTRAAVFANDELVPQAERGAALAEKAYELGDTLVLGLLQSQRARIEARRTRVAALFEAARARIELEKRLGAPLPSGEPPTP